MEDGCQNKGREVKKWDAVKRETLIPQLYYKFNFLNT